MEDTQQLTKLLSGVRNEYIKGNPLECGEYLRYPYNHLVGEINVLEQSESHCYI